MVCGGSAISDCIRRSVRRPRAGFTLAEIIVVVTIVGLLAASFTAAVSVYQPTATADQLLPLIAGSTTTSRPGS